MKSVVTVALFATVTIRIPALPVLVLQHLPGDGLRGGDVIVAAAQPAYRRYRIDMRLAIRSALTSRMGRRAAGQPMSSNCSGVNAPIALRVARPRHLNLAVAISAAMLLRIGHDCRAFDGWYSPVFVCAMLVSHC